MEKHTLPVLKGLTKLPHLSVHPFERSVFSIFEKNDAHIFVPSIVEFCEVFIYVKQTIFCHILVLIFMHA